MGSSWRGSSWRNSRSSCGAGCTSSIDNVGKALAALSGGESGGGGGKWWSHQPAVLAAAASAAASTAARVCDGGVCVVACVCSCVRGCVSCRELSIHVRMNYSHHGPGRST